MESQGDLFSESTTGTNRPSVGDDREAMRRDIAALFGPVSDGGPIAPAQRLDAESIAEVFTRPVAVVSATGVSGGYATGEPSEPTLPPPVPAPRTPRPRSPWMRRGIIVGAAAVVVVVVVAVVLVVGTLRSRAELTAAQEQLASQRAELADAQRSLDVAGERLQAAVSAGITEADEVDAALATVTGYVDEGARAAAVAAVSAYRTGLTTLPAASTAADDDVKVDETSSSAIAEGIDRMRRQAGDVTDDADRLTDAFADVGDLTATLRAALVPFGDAVTAAAATEIEEAPDADEALQQAVSAAADAITAALAAGRSAAPEITAFPPTVDTMRADQHAKDLALEEARRNQRLNQTRPPSTTPVTPTPEPSTPSESSDPVETEPVQPDPPEQTPAPESTGEVVP